MNNQGQTMYMYCIWIFFPWITFPMFCRTIVFRSADTTYQFPQPQTGWPRQCGVWSLLQWPHDGDSLVSREWLGQAPDIPPPQPVPTPRGQVLSLCHWGKLLLSVLKNKKKNNKKNMVSCFWLWATVCMQFNIGHIIIMYYIIREFIFGLVKGH